MSGMDANVKMSPGWRGCVWVLVSHVRGDEVRFSGDVGSIWRASPQLKWGSRADRVMV